MYKQHTIGALRLSVVAVAIAVLTACGTVSEVDDAGHTQHPVFPAMKDSSMPEGYYVNLENLGKMRPGMTKKQVMELIGHPQFSEGMFGVREWDYILKFRQGEGQPDKVCQYKVLFDKDMQAQSFFYLPADCNSSTAAQPVAHEPQVQNVNLAADATFAFGSAVLRPEGRAKLDKIASEAEAAKVTAIDIVGHTDRIGSAQANQKLSLERAMSVRDYLVRQGMPASAISVDGRGDSQPLVECAGPASPAVIACLAPNRRTTITIRTQ